jgi:hypothetical protein
MSYYDIYLVANCGKVRPRIPAQQQVEIMRHRVQLFGDQRASNQEWSEQFTNLSGIHRFPRRLSQADDSAKRLSAVKGKRNHGCARQLELSCCQTSRAFRGLFVR